MKHSDDIRMRKLNSGETLKEYERLSKSERKQRPALYWQDSKFWPLRFVFWPDTNREVQAAYLRAMYQMEKDVGCQLFERGRLSNTDLQVGLGQVDLDEVDDPDNFLASKAPWQGDQGVMLGPTVEHEQGFCELTWADDGRVLSANVGVEVDLSFFDMWRVAAHELGHALLLGHDKHVPGRLMHVNYGGVKRLKPLERRWVRQIHNLPGKK